MEGSFGVFDGDRLLAEFGTDDDAQSYRRDLLELNIPEPFRRPAYDDLDVRDLDDDAEEDEDVASV